MNLDQLDNGSYVAPDDPGEPGTGRPRISITERESQLLAFLAANKRVLEIGTGLGISTDRLACHALEVWTVDIDPWVHANVFPALHKDVKCFTDRDQIPESEVFDVVFIDGRHTVVDTHVDIEYAQSRCPRGIIVVHDAGLPEVYEALTYEFGADWAMVETTHGIAVMFVGWE